MPDSQPLSSILARIFVLQALFSSVAFAVNCGDDYFCSAPYPGCAGFCLGDIDNGLSLVHSCGGRWSDMCGEKDNIVSIYSQVWVECVTNNCTETQGAAQAAWDAFTISCLNNSETIPASLVPAGYTIKGRTVSIFLFSLQSELFI